MRIVQNRRESSGGDGEKQEYGDEIVVGVDIVYE
jgi:hypothetical protein